jgi:predicted RNA polymerase sigma factor
VAKEGIPRNPGAWLMAIAKRRGIDHFRRNKLTDEKHQQVGYEMEARQEDAAPDFDAALDDELGDDLLRLIFTACHPVLSTEARVTLTLKLLAGPHDGGNRARVSLDRHDDSTAHRPRQAHAGRQEGRV